MNKVAIIKIHGIKWRAKDDWQNDFGDYLLKKKDNGFKVFHFRYGGVLASASWLMTATKFLKLNALLKNGKVKAFAKFIKKIKKRFPDYDISILAHSFGGWLVYEYLAQDEDTVFKNIVFAHCPIDSHIENTSFWNWLQFEKIKRVFCWCSHNDDVIGKIAIKPFGQNGYWGFIRFDQPGDREYPAKKPYGIELYNEFTNEKHSGILEKYRNKLFDQLVG